MAKEYLCIKPECNDNYRIAWFLPEDADYGRVLGEGDDDGKGDPPSEREEWETWAACKAIAAMNPERNGGGWFWESERDARVALRVAKEALKQDRPLPEWAQTALAAGWKPPKGWRA